MGWMLALWSRFVPPPLAFLFLKILRELLFLMSIGIEFQTEGKKDRG